MPQVTIIHQDSSSSGAPLWTRCNSLQVDIETNNKKRISLDYKGNRHRLNTIKSFHHIRWVVMSLASIGFGLALIYCDCMAVAIVGMVKLDGLHHQDTTNDKGDPSEILIEFDAVTVNNNNSDIINNNNTRHDQFIWNNLIQSLVVNSYFLGYAIPQVPLAIAATRFGINRIVILSYLVAIVCMFLMPIVSIRFGWPLVLAIRFLKGLAGAAMYSIPIGMVDYWLPARESTKAITLMMFIGNIGICLNPLISGYLTSIHWSLVFYVFACAGIVWVILWAILVTDKPEQCWLMSQQELRLILDERAADLKPDQSNKAIVTNMTDPSQQDAPHVYHSNAHNGHFIKCSLTSPPPINNDEKKEPPNRTPPWKCLMSDRNVLTLILIFVVYFGSYLSFINLLPTYFKNKMHLDIKTSALLTFLIQSASLFASLWGGALLTYLVDYRQWSTRSSRLTVSAIAALGSSLMWTIPFVGLSDEYCVIGFAINRALHPAMEICLIASVVERWTSQGLSGVMVSLYNSLGNFFSLIIAAFSGYILDLEYDTDTIWSSLFMVYATINIISWLLLNIVDQTPPIVARLELAEMKGQPLKA